LASAVSPLGSMELVQLIYRQTAARTLDDVFRGDPDPGFWIGMRIRIRKDPYSLERWLRFLIQVFKSPTVEKKMIGNTFKNVLLSRFMVFSLAKKLPVKSLGLFKIVQILKTNLHIFAAKCGILSLWIQGLDSDGPKSFLNPFVILTYLQPRFFFFIHPDSDFELFR
jgi:hypothetical protein